MYLVVNKPSAPLLLTLISNGIVALREHGRSNGVFLALVFFRTIFELVMAEFCLTGREGTLR